MSNLQAEAIAIAPRRGVWTRWPALGHLREYVPTIATEFAVLITQVLVYKLAAYYLGKEGFSEYAVVRRAATFLAPLPLLGLGVGLPRYIAISRGKNNPRAATHYFGAAFLCVLSGIFLCLAVLNAWGHHFAFLLFGDDSYAGLVFPLSLMIFGLSLHTLAYAYFRGQLAMTRANLLQLVNYAAVPVLVFFLVGNHAASVLLWLGVLWTLVASVALGFTPIGQALTFQAEELRELLRFGIQRVPGDFILMALLSLPVVFVAHRAGMQQAGFVAFGISVLAMIGALVSPIGLVLLPKASGLLASGKKAELRSHIRHIMALALLFSAGASALIWFSAPALIRLYLGPGFEAAASVLRVIVLGGVPYALFAVLRNLIDAFHRNAVTALITALSFCVFLAGEWAGSLHISVENQTLVALVVSLGILGGATSWECMRILRIESGPVAIPAVSKGLL